MLNESHYQYGFEIEDILKQFFALIDKSVVLRYEKVENERRLVQTITPTYKFTTKSRALLMSLNSAKNFVLPCVVCEVTGIQADKERLAAKKTMISRYKNNLLHGYQYPTPITISVSLNIVTKYKSDLFQIYGNLATLFQPECFISWIVPTNPGIHGVEELRNKVEWDFNMNLESKETIKEEDEDRFIGKMSFSIQGWLFRNPRECFQPPILDIGTTTLVTNELENRLDGLIDMANPLTSQYGSLYSNPRQFATSHVRILKAFATASINNKNYYFRISKDNYDSFRLRNSERDYLITFDGYNLANSQALFVPKDKIASKTKSSIKEVEINFSQMNSKINPYINTDNKKPNYIKGIPLEIVSSSDNTLIVKLPKINYIGDFDIILYDTIDYDSLQDAESILLKATN